MYSSFFLLLTSSSNPKNHTVTQSSFNTPCVSSNGFKTGLYVLTFPLGTRFNLPSSVPVSANTSSADLPVKQFTVPAGDAPLWFYCGQTGHCGQGMCQYITLPLLNQCFIKEWSLRSMHPPIQTPIRSAPSKNLPSRLTGHHPPPKVPSPPPLPSTGRPQLPLSPQEAPLGPPHTRAMTERLVSLTYLISIYN